ncbi:MAG: hypothetical protein PHF98_05140 [Patescibacteria group bacterium]|nr:hypothetical protein [Patescibacteria group bacterium]
MGQLHAQHHAGIAVALRLIVGGMFACVLIPNIAHAQDITWAQSSTTGLGDAGNLIVYSLAEYEGHFYTATSNWNDGTRVLRLDGSTWTQVNTDGFGDAMNVEGPGLAVYDGKLYVATQRLITGAEVWAYDGTTWSQANTDGFGDAENYIVMDVTVFNDKLYAATGNFSTGCEFWEYDGDSWTQVNTDGFGDHSNTYCMASEEYQGELYVGTYKDTQPAELWKYDGSDWSMVGTDGFGDATNEGFMDLQEFGGSLYISTENPTNGGEVWKYDGAEFTRVSHAGFDDDHNTGVYSLETLTHHLYAGTTNAVTGTEMWSYDGSSWAQVNEDGFGGTDGYSTSLLSAYDNILYAGTNSDSDGTQMWKGELEDSTGPVVSDLVPANAARGVARGTDITFSITDAVLDVDSASLDVLVDGVYAIVDGELTEDFSGTITQNETWSYEITIQPGADFYYGQLVSITATVSDSGANQSSLSWTFMTSDAIPSLGIVVTPASAGGPNVRIVEDDGTQIESFFAYDQSLRMGLEVAQADIDADSVNEIVITPGAGVESRIKAFELDGTEMANTLAFNEGFTGGVNLATGDFDGDHKEDIAVTPIGAGGPNIRIYTYNVAEEEFELMDWFFGYSEEFRGGVNLASGDLDSDGVDELIVTPRGAMAPIVKVFRYSAADQEFDLVDSVTAYQDTFFGGVQVATGDVDSDGNDDIIVAPFLNGGPNIRIYTLNGSDELELLDWLMAYDSSYRGTLSMQVGDTDGDGSNEVVLAPKTLGDSTVKVLRYQGGDFEEVDSFMAYDAHFMGGVNLFVNDVDADGFDEVMTSPASHGGPNLRVYDYDTDTGVLKDWFWVFPVGFRGGVNFGK